MEHQVEDFVFSETAAPKRRVLRTDGALYLALLAAVIVVIMLGYRLSAAWALPRFYVQLALYAVLLGLGYLAYRKCLVSFRYTLTDRMLRVERVVGKKARPDAHIHLLDILSVRPYSELNEDVAGKLETACVGGRRDALAVTYDLAGKKHTILLSLSEENRRKLVQQWKNAIH